MLLCNYSQSFFPNHIQKRFQDLDDKQDIKAVIDNMKNDSEDINRQLKQYNCSTESELIKKMSLELNYYELFIKKFNDLAFLINLKLNTDLGDSSYQDTFSKFFLIKSVIEKLLGKMNESNGSSSSSLTTLRKETITTDTFSDENKILEMSHIDQFFKYESENKVIQHIKKLLSTSYNLIALDLEDISDKHKDVMDKVPSKLIDLHERIIQWDLFLGKLLCDKETKIKKLNNQISELETYIKNLNADQSKVLISENTMNSNHKMLSAEEESSKVKSLLKMIEESKLSNFILF